MTAKAWLRSALGRGWCSAAVASMCLLAQLIFGTAAMAQPGGVEPGRIQREQTPTQSPQSTTKPVLPAVTPPGSPEGAGGIRFTLQSLTFEGNSVISTEELMGAANLLIGQPVAVNEIFDLAKRITRLYAERGYALSVAFVPEQDIVNGRVRIRIVEGYIKEVLVEGDLDLTDPLVSAHASALKISRPLTTVELERYLLLLNDIPGLKARSAIEKIPGANDGGMKLLIKTELDPVEANFNFNNRGSDALGQERGQFDVSLNNLLGLHEEIALSYLQTADLKELSYASASIRSVVNEDGLQLRLEGTLSRSEPGTPDLSALNFQSNGWTVLIGANYPLIRARAENLVLRLTAQYKDLHSDVLLTPRTRDKLSVVELSGSYDFVNNWDGITQVGARLRQGLDVLDATQKGDPFASRAGADAAFTVAEVFASYVQPVTETFDLLLDVSGQYADSRLLSSETCGYGGGIYGRAFDSYEISGEHCLNALVEVRANIRPGDLGLQKQLSRIQPYVFYDAGIVRSRGATLPGEKKNETGQSVGIGLRLAHGRDVSLSIEYAHPLTRDVAIERDDNGRVFFSLNFAL